MNHSKSHHSQNLHSCYDGGASNRSGLALYSIHHRSQSQRCQTHQRNQTNSQSRHREILRHDRKIRHNQLGSLEECRIHLDDQRGSIKEWRIHHDDQRESLHQRGFYCRSTKRWAGCVVLELTWVETMWDMKQNLHFYTLFQINKFVSPAKRKSVDHIGGKRKNIRSRMAGIVNLWYSCGISI